MVDMIIKIILFTFILTSFIGCVGTVEEGVSPKAVSASVENSDIQFEGVVNVVAIADDKVDVYWRPATGGSEIFNYVIYYGGGEVPTLVPSDIVSPDYQGLLKFTLTNLLPGYRYKVKIDVKDQITNEQTVTDAVEEDTTFYNDVCNFSGIGKVENLPGIAGTDSIKVQWPHAQVESDGLLKIPGSDPKTYEVTALDSNIYTPADFDNVGLNNNVGRFVEYVTYLETQDSVVIRGLPSSTEYYVRVRCIHKDSIQDLSKPFLAGELNTDYLKIETLSNDLGSINYDPDEIQLIPGSGEAAGRTFSLVWGNFTGVFDHFRIYYSKGTITMGTDCFTNVPQGNVFCKKLAYTEDGSQVYPLEKETIYNVQLVVCQTVMCATSERIVAKTFTFDTSQVLSPFLGIESIEFAKKLDDLGQITLGFTPPNLLLGSFDGFVVRHKLGIAAPEEDITEYDPGHLNYYTGQLMVESHNHLTTDSVVITSVAYNTSNCFNVSLFTYKSDGSRTITLNEKWMCKTPVIEAPTALSFTGIAIANINSNAINTTLNMNWAPPSSGVYSVYELFILHNGTAYNQSTAVTETNNGDDSNYYRFELPGATTNLSLNFVDPGTYYIGIGTDHVDINGHFRSSINNGVVKCVVPALPVDDPMTPAIDESIMSTLIECDPI